MEFRKIPYLESKKYVLIALLTGVLVLMLCLFTCSRNGSSERRLHSELIKSGGDTLDIAIEISPLSFRASGDSIAGLDYEIMQGISCMTGRPVKYHAFSSLKEATQAMNDGLFDIIISSLPATEALKEKFLLTDEIYLDREVLVQHKDSKPFYDSPEQLGRDTLWIAAGSPFIDRIYNLSSEIGQPIYIAQTEGRTAEHLVMLVARREIPRAVVNEGLARRMRDEHYPELSIETPISFTQFQSWIVSHKHRSLADSLNTWINRFRLTPEYSQILSKYGVTYTDSLSNK